MAATAIDVRDLVERGWAVFPCKGKLPAIKGGGGHLDATSDTEIVDRWWYEYPDASVGVACTAETGLLVIDVDPRNGGDNTIKALLADHDEWPNTLTALTPGGGFHLYFEHPGGNLRGTLGAGIDVKHNGYVIAPPSTGYRWVDADMAVAPVPEWLLALLRPTGRNVRLAQLAGGMRRVGATAERMADDLASHRERDGLPSAEVEKVANSIARYPVAMPFTDAGNAECLAAMFGDTLRFDHRARAWRIFRGHRWVHDATGEIVRIAKQVARERHFAALNITDDTQRAAEIKWALQSESRQRLDAMITLARSEPPIADSGEGWDSDPFLLGCENGLIDLQTGALRAGRPEDRVTLTTGLPYDADATCPRWLRFLDEVFGDADVIAFVRRWIGYCVTGDTSEQCLVVGVGRGANGKSTLLTILLAMLGDYAANTTFKTFELYERGDLSNDVAALQGKRLITASETNEAARLNEARIKALTGGDVITARRLYHEYASFRPVGKIMLAANHRPRALDDSDGFWRRIRLLEFPRAFALNPALEGELRAELPGILAWGVRACLEWHAEGLGEPASMRAATDEYRADSDHLGQFIAEACDVGDAYRATATQLRGAYGHWCGARNMTPREMLAWEDFGQRLAQRFERKHRKHGNVYFGIRCRG